MERQQAIRIINQLLDEYKRTELNWNLGGKQEIYWDSDYRHCIEGEAEWKPCFDTRYLGDEEQIMGVLEPELYNLDCHVLTYSDDGEKLIKAEIITEYDL